MSTMKDEASHSGVVRSPDPEGQPSAKRQKIEIWTRLPMEQIFDVLERAAAGVYRPTTWVRAEVRQWMCRVRELATISKAVHRRLQPWIERVMGVCHLYREFEVAQSLLEDHVNESSSRFMWRPEYDQVKWFNPWTLQTTLVLPPPILFPLVNVGSHVNIYPHELRCSFTRFHGEKKETIVRELQKVVELIPESVHCISGRVLGRSKCTPLAIALYNAATDASVWEVLLRHGADPFPRVLIYAGADDGPLSDVVKDMQTDWQLEVGNRSLLSMWNTRADQIVAVLKPYQAKQ
jgi:hypothetical protein